MPSRILLSCDKYKGNLTALQVCSIIKSAIKDVDRTIKVDICPMADGGEGTVDTLVESLDGKFIFHVVQDPLGNDIKAKFGLIKKNMAVIEMSSASGLSLIPPEKRNPLVTSTFGTGELIKKALELGRKKILIGIGGSATNDAGLGMAQALGIIFYDKMGRILGKGGKELINLENIDIGQINPLVKKAEILVACDVDNPLYGEKGAAYIYGPQKGADQKTVELLDRGLKNFARVVKKDLKKNVHKFKGAGAAGGLGAGLFAFLNAKLKPGTEIIADAIFLEDKIRKADLVITGEGAMDNQTFFGKSAYGVAKIAKKYEIPVITINGSVNVSYDQLTPAKEKLFAANFDTVNKPMDLEYAIKEGKELLYITAREVIKFYKAVTKNK